MYTAFASDIVCMEIKQLTCGSTYTDILWQKHLFSLRACLPLPLVLHINIVNPFDKNGPFNFMGAQGTREGEGGMGQRGLMT